MTDRLISVTARMAMVLVVACLVPAAGAAIPASQRTVLLNLYAQTNGASWTTRTNWNGPAGTECTWFGITCDVPQANVVQINLQGNNLNGTLPGISALAALQVFAVSNNSLTGPLPSLAGLTALTVFVAPNNQFTGSIPSLSGLTALGIFNVRTNRLSGSIPSLAGLTNLSQFLVYQNQLTGPIPPLTGLPLLAIFVANDNQLGGSIPPLAATAIQQFLVANNKLTGAVPQPPASLSAGQSTLCGNVLLSNSAAIDSAWTTATGSNWLLCQIPACTLTATPPAITAGGSATLAVSCLPAATSYAWSPNAGFGSTVASATVSPTVTTTYTVTPSTSGGTGSPASVTVVVNVIATPVCNIVASRNAVSAGTSVTLTAVCSPAATSYAWSGGTCGATTTSTCAIAPAVTTTYTVAGINAGGRGNTASAIVTVTPRPFPMTATINVTPALANVTAQIQPAPADVGRNASIFVFAHVPLSLLAKSAAKHGSHGIEAQLLDGTDPCVLAQVDSSGRLVAVTADTMRALLTGVLGSQVQIVAIVNNVPTPVVAGASFFVGYGTTATTMFSTGTYQGVVVINGAVQCTAAVAAPAAPTAPSELSGLWWQATESGWGIHFTQRRNVIFAAWYTYDTSGNAKWFVSTCNMPGTTAALSGTCTGSVLDVTASPFFGAAFNASAVSSLTAGNLQVRFDNVNAASMTYTVRATTRTVALTRQPLAAGTTQPAVNYTDLWWNPTESGWGLAMAQQYGITFLAWYVYDAAGRPTWYVATCAMSGSNCTGPLYRTTGPAFGPTFNANEVRALPAGTITVNFIDANNATITYTVDGVSASKMVTRQLF